MLPGTPLFATYDPTGVLRTFQLVAGVFTQIASQGGFVQASNPVGPQYPFFAWADEQIVVVRSLGTTNRNIELLDLFLSSVATLAQATISNTAQYRAGYAKDARIVTILPASGSNGNFGKSLIGNGTITQDAMTGLPTSSFSNVVPSPDGSLWPRLAGTSITNLVNPGLGQGFNNKGTLNGVRATIGAWDASQGYLIAGTPGDAYATVFRYNPTTAQGYEETYRIEDVEGTLVAIAAAPYGKMLAICWQIGDSRVTRLYRRQGGFYQFVQTLPGMGQLLNFSANGTILVDGAARKAAVLNPDTGLFVDTPGMVVNLPAGTVAQAFSDHAPLVLSTAAMYQSGLELVASGAFNLSQLKFTVATDSAPAFDVLHDTLAEATGGAEVTAGGWPAGGIPVLGAQLITETPGSVRVDCDDPERIIIESSATFRYGFLHVDGVPVCRYDFQQNVTVSQNSKAVFTVPIDGILTLLM